MIIDNSIVDRQGITFIDGESPEWLACRMGVTKKSRESSRMNTNQEHSNLIRVSSRAFAAEFALASS
jgi:hypothetical protein